ncbi:MAG: 50S ribosomal protein L9 [Candidatus Brocadiia bacterium]
MEVLLWQDINRLGKRGSVVNVSDGYAHNYLFPRRLASLPSKENVREMENEKKRFVRTQEDAKVKTGEIAGQIEQASCTIEVKANEEGGLFGSVSPQLIVDALIHEGITGVTPQMIELETPIKELGVYRAKVNLCEGVSAVCRLWVVEEHLTEKKGSDKGAK